MRVVEVDSEREVEDTSFVDPYKPSHKQASLKQAFHHSPFPFLPDFLQSTSQVNAPIKLKTDLRRA
jgi:hypothetical protein